jgi:hypothetical protein
MGVRRFYSLAINLAPLSFTCSFLVKPLLLIKSVLLVYSLIILKGSLL